MKNTLTQLIQIIKTGSRAEVKIAQKQVEKIWHSYDFEDREKQGNDFKVFLDELKNFDSIKDIDHQAYFINILKWPLWSMKNEYFDIWAEFFLRLIQHPSGKIRQAVISAMDYLIINITPDINYQDKITYEKNINYFCNLVYSVEILLSKYDEPRFGRYKYISSLPISVFKSLQILINNSLLRSEYHIDLYEKWIQQNYYQNRNIVDIDQQKLKQKRQEIEKELRAALMYYELGDTLSFEGLKKIIKEESGSNRNEPIKLISEKILEKIGNIEEAQAVLNLVVAMWNYFPHDSLGGLCPEEMYKKLYD